MEKKNLFIIYLGRTGSIPKFVLELSKEILLNKKIKNFKLLISEYNLLKKEIIEINKETKTIKTPKTNKESITKIVYIISEITKIIFKARKENNKNFLFPMTHIWNPIVIIIIKILIPKSNIFYISHDANIHPGDKNAKLQYIIMQIEIFLSNKIICLTNNVKNILKEKWTKKEFIILPHPAYDLGIKKEIRKISGTPTFLFFGRIIKYKGLSILIKSFLIAREKLLIEDKNIKLIIAGEGNIDEKDLKLINNNLDSIELIHKYIDESEISKIWDRSDICALTYTEASQSGVIAIAVNKSMPCIITPIKGLIEQTLINDIEKAFALVSENLDENDIALTMIKMTEKDLYSKLSKNALNHQKEMCWDKWIIELLNK